jgi:FAD/FMN-containing dehydrogenase
MSLIDDLTALVGRANVLTGDAAADQIRDYRGVVEGRATAVVRPAGTAEVAAVVARCARDRVAIVPQGGNTGLSAGQIPATDRPTVVVSLQRMQKIEEVNAAQWTMTVQAGVTITAMHEAAAAARRSFPPDWGARGTATIGGAIATDAGGINVLRYGNMRDQILGVEAVLADGRIWNGLRALRKDSSGYDLKQLFIGAEGTLGIVTRATVKLMPPTPHVQSAMAALVDLDQLMDFYALAREVAPTELTAFELIPEVGLARVVDRFGVIRPMPAGPEFHVLFKLAGTDPVTDTIGEVLSQAADRGYISDAVVAGTAEHEDRLWLIRDELPAASIFPDTQHVALKMDTAVPIDRIRDFHRRVSRLAAELAPDALSYGFGHVGDGNMHMYVLPAEVAGIDSFVARRSELERRIDAMTFELGGTLSAEHGIGRTLRLRIGPQKPAIEWDLMRAVKAAFDPHGIMNPGALLPDPG